MSAKSGGAAADLRRRRERAWSSQKEAKALRENRRERKEVKRKADRFGKMSDTEKAKELELDDLIAKVRKQTAAAAAEEDFEGFGD